MLEGNWVEVKGVSFFLAICAPHETYVGCKRTLPHAHTNTSTSHIHSEVIVRTSLIFFSPFFFKEMHCLYT